MYITFSFMFCSTTSIKTKLCGHENSFFKIYIGDRDKDAGREGEREKNISMCWVTSQMPTKARAWPGQARYQGCHPSLAQEWQKPQPFSHHYYLLGQELADSWNQGVGPGR